MTVPVLQNTPARRLFLDRHGLIKTTAGSGRGADLAGVIHDLGFVQLDSVNTLARAHDLILWSRRQQYRPAHLNIAHSRDRAVFEHWTHDAAAIPMEFYPHWKLKFDRDAANIRKRWKNWQGEFEHRLDDVMNHIAKNGSCGSGALSEGEKKGSTGWWDWNPSKTAMEYLWRSGQLAIARRDGFRKIYDLSENVIPADMLAKTHSTDDTIDWCCRQALTRLGFATSGEIAAFWDIVTPAEAKSWCQRALADGTLIEIDIALNDGTLRRSFAWPETLDIPTPTPSNRVRILSPFDPALRDRKRAERLFGFHFRIEIFVPEAKRKYAYYVFPVLEGDTLIGRIDIKADRPNNTLNLTSFWPETGVRWGKGRETRLMAELDRIAKLAECDHVNIADGWLKQT
ncbi:winged helix-turn-helix domain-containing protein [Aestuariibius sp. HNIBRBA575]|uniref:winged helix-turn-helix domain-containing protein n=1 Tax=Aestuariibius sp. HNIBRBA575 TaxID=3233343 RepID=UPI0034A19612